jgi:hypothetical protein
VSIDANRHGWRSGSLFGNVKPPLLICPSVQRLIDRPALSAELERLTDSRPMQWRIGHRAICRPGSGDGRCGLFDPAGVADAFGRFSLPIDLGAPMERGLLVELSPNEETALQRIAQGVMSTADMEHQHIAPKAARFDRGDRSGL